MAALAEMLAFLIKAISSVIQLLVIGSVLVSLLGADPSNPLVRMLSQTTEPLYRPIRRFTSRIPGPLDWAPLVVILLVLTLETGLLRFLQTVGR